MPRQKTSDKTEFIWDPGTANPKQKAFFESRALYTAYGGAKGGGKTWAVRTKALLGAYCHPGIKILIMRRTYPELQKNHIEPMLKEVICEISSYNANLHTMYFENGSIISFGHWQGDYSEQSYNGQEYDWIFIDEATQFSWRSFQFLGGLLRGVNDIPRRMYITCNPGGIGHAWVKRLFIDREYIKSENPEECENPEDYLFIPATVEDNELLLKSSPTYLKMLSSMPESQKRAYRYGDWSALSGTYFSEFSERLHVIKPFPIPRTWRRYMSFDYGLDMFALLWICCDPAGRAYVYREFSASDLIVGAAARAALENTPTDEKIDICFAPPDMWQRQKDTGKTMADVFFENGLPILKSDNSRTLGHMLIKEALSPGQDAQPRLLFFSSCRSTIDDIKNIQADEENPNDAAKFPHECTHRVDALRYFITSRIITAERKSESPAEKQGRFNSGYADYMTGGSISADYLRC